MAEIPAWVPSPPRATKVTVHPVARWTEEDAADRLRRARTGWACFASRIVVLGGDWHPAPEDGLLLEAELVEGTTSVSLRRVDGVLHAVTIEEGSGEACLAEPVRLLARAGLSVPGTHLDHIRYWRRSRSPGQDTAWRPWLSRFVGFSGVS